MPAVTMINQQSAAKEQSQHDVKLIFPMNEYGQVLSYLCVQGWVMRPIQDQQTLLHLGHVFLYRVDGTGCLIQSVTRCLCCSRFSIFCC